MVSYLALISMAECLSSVIKGIKGQVLFRSMIDADDSVIKGIKGQVLLVPMIDADEIDSFEFDSFEIRFIRFDSSMHLLVSTRST